LHTCSLSDALLSTGVIAVCSFSFLGCLSPIFSVHKFCCILSEVHAAWRPAVLNEIFIVFLSASRYVLGLYFKLVLDHFLSNSVIIPSLYSI
jgi:hypothetical protein